MTTEPTASADALLHEAMAVIEALRVYATVGVSRGPAFDGWGKAIEAYHAIKRKVADARTAANASEGSAPDAALALAREKEILREGNRIVIGAIDEFRAAVGELFAMRHDGPCLAERAPSKDTDCLFAFQRLNDTGARLAAIADKLREIHSATTRAVEPTPAPVEGVTEIRLFDGQWSNIVNKPGQTIEGAVRATEETMHENFIAKAWPKQRIEPPANHAPLPWRYVPWHVEEGESAVRDANGDIVCCVASDDLAQFIVYCANWRNVNLERARQRPKDDVSAPRDTDCEAIRDERIGVLARAEDGSAAMTMVLREPDAPRDFDPGTVIATLTLGDGRTASDRVTASWAAQTLRELGGARS